MRIYLIAAMSSNEVIGIDNRLPWHIPKDLKWFKMNTMGGVLLMGRKTWDSLPKKPLPNRTHIVLSRQAHESQKNVIWCQNFRDALRIACELDKILYVIGGEDIFIQAYPYADILLLTRVHTQVKGNHLRYIPIPKKKRLIWKSSQFKHKTLPFHFEMYALKNESC